ncbi:MAG: hypothetical protein HYR96_01370 [Deltaproteobacteria bacterium]|nr:hypothetical protein [Deltaproteobacteria bacterium]MBI3294367.1 hypothetical protein [Deltaproteobacteria bacterium]
MGYYIRFLERKTELQPWKLQFITYKKTDTRDSKAQRPRKEWDIPQIKWQPLGFHSNMTLEIARARAKQLNAQLELRLQEERRKAIDEKFASLETETRAVLPEIFKDEFELRFISSRYDDPKWQRRMMTSWRATQRMLIEIQLDPMHWFDENTRFYDYFHSHRFSFSYIRKILIFTNMWGQFLSRKLGQSFTKVPQPRGKEKARLLDAYFAKCGGSSNQSDPITPQQLEKARADFKEENYNWLFLSVWLGLRPQEVDQLKQKEMVRIQRGIGVGTFYGSSKQSSSPCLSDIAGS